MEDFVKKFDFLSKFGLLLNIFSIWGESLLLCGHSLNMLIFCTFHWGLIGFIKHSNSSTTFPRAPTWKRISFSSSLSFSSLSYQAWIFYTWMVPSDCICITWGRWSRFTWSTLKIRTNMCIKKWKYRFLSFLRLALACRAFCFIEVPTFSRFSGVCDLTLRYFSAKP